MTRIALVEVRDAPPDTAANTRAGLASMAAAADAGAGLVVFPELFLGGYYLDHAMAQRAVGAAAALSRFQAAVDESGVAAVVGAALIGSRGPAAALAGSPAAGHAAMFGSLPAADGVLLNAVAVLRPEVPASYGIKAHLYPGEDQWFTPGNELWTDRVAGWACGVGVCYEVGFPEVARCLSLAGAQLILLPAAFGRSRYRIWDTLTRARAIENGCYLAAAGQAGSAGGQDFLGHSRLVDPFGEIVAGEEAGDRGEPALTVGQHTVFVGEIRTEMVAAARRGDGGWHRTLRDRRPRLYHSLTEE